jgi:L-2-hydroxycarboxylate dehydrogenase (NAD+)
MKIKFELLKKFVSHVFFKLGVPLEDSLIISDVIVKADLYGFKTHGISRLSYYMQRIYDGIQNTSTFFQIVNSSQATAVVDGNNGMGQVVGDKSMKIAIDKASEYGVGCVVAKNSSHFGICSYYSLMAVEKNMIGIVFTNARPSVAAFGGEKAILGTNPFSIGMPSNTHPFLIDCSTSIVQRGNVEVWERNGESVPKDVAIPETENPTDLLKLLQVGQAALKTIGGHKGYGLSVAIELFCSALSNGSALNELKGHYEGLTGVTYDIGHFFLVIDPTHFIDIALFKNKVSEVRKELKKTGDCVLVPGDIEFENKSNEIEIDSDLYNEIKIIACQFNYDLEV